jgi:hypothetical protein
MSFVQYKFTKLYSNVIYKKKRNMDKTIKFSTILLFVFLFFITKEIAGQGTFFRYTQTDIKCTSTQDCPDDVLTSYCSVSLCRDGYCLKVSMKPE